ncbi:MAG: PcfJ domain-containing protein [Christensenellaceae bacterium]|jgi:hypothetical protein|nr:PcfJ domain-containing protein [Christensenellaceae bacterium]
MKPRPIPKYILKRLHELDMKNCPDQKGQPRFYAYLAKIRGELVKITVACKSYYKKWYCKQVAIHGTRSAYCLAKDIDYKYCVAGYRVGWHEEGLCKYETYYEKGWLKYDFKYFNIPHTTIVNKEFLATFPEIKYSAWQYYEGACIIKYLRLWAKHPQTEYLLKFGLHKIHDSITILKLIAKDKQFCKFLIANKDAIIMSHYYVPVIIAGYKTEKSLNYLQSREEFKKRCKNDQGLQRLGKMFNRDLEKFFTYLDEQNTNARSYLDYLNACEFLGLNMNLAKHRFPHNFQRWHDTRIDEMNARKAELDAEKKAQLYEQFGMVANKYLRLQKKGLYAVIIAKSPAELIREGAELNHCVGRVNYDQKMAREETLIFFIRSLSEPDTPFVTLEYSPQSRKVLQCYGVKDTRPDESVLTFVNNDWLPYANKQLKRRKIS